MDIYKLRPGLSPVHKIGREQFEEDTGKKAPWYQEEGNETIQFAVCPACNNPIRIIALYKRHDNSPTAYGKHTPKSVEGITLYNQTAYNECPYAHPGREIDRNKRLQETDPRGKDNLLLLKNQFDRVIYLLKRCTGICISESLARKLLDSFLGMRGHLYVGTTLCNLPWMFAYMTTSQSLFGSVIEKNSLLMNSLKKNKHIEITEEGKIISAHKKYIDINFCFMHHKMTSHGNSYKETIKFIVSLWEENIFQMTIEIDPMHFHNLVNLPPERARRNQRLLDIAEELIHV